MKQLTRLSSAAIIFILLLSIFSSPILSHSNIVHAQDEFPTQPTEPAVVETPTPAPTEEPAATPTVESTITPTEEPTSLSDKFPEIETPVAQGFQWSIQIENKYNASSNTLFSSLDSLSSQGVIGELVDNKLNLSGSRDIGQMVQTIFEGLPEGFDFLGGPISLVITYPAETGKEITIHLETRTTTGYSWVFLPSRDSFFTQSGESDLHARSTGLGVSSVQTMTFTPNFSGTGTLHLVYQRAFEPDHPMDTHLQLTLVDQTTELDLSDPNPVFVVNRFSALSSGKFSTEFDANLVTSENLPASFDWRTYGVVPSVRNQGGCGGCWAFGTVGIMESAIKIGGGALVDLSEQFLISCNNDGWSCNGGLTATKYHFNTLGKNQTAIGAVLESDKPYTASNGSCSIISKHPYTATNWTFVSGYESKIPTVDQIKSAIHTYGPVTARVCTGSSWNSYKGGVYSTDEPYSTCSGSVNHQIILVGWNDVNQTWILRNSWGSSWGDGGYMHIRWNTSRVGEGASWVKYGDSITVPVAPVLVSPATGTLNNNKILNLTWLTVPHASSFDVQVDNNSDFTSPESIGISLSTTSFTASLLADATYFWRVRAKNILDEVSPWSDSRNFAIDSTPPIPPVLSTPTNGTQVLSTPTFTWLASSTAKAYQFQYDTNHDGDPETYIFRSPEVTTLSYKPTVTPELMVPIYWSVRAKDSLGNWSDWSSPFTITVVPPLPLTPVLTAPVYGLLTNNPNPTLAWNTVAYAATYEIQIDNNFRFPAPLIQEYVGITTLSHVIDSLPDGKYYWRVRARNVNNSAGSWSSDRDFTVDATAPAVPVLTKPLNASQSIDTPTFTWQASATASRYQLQYETTLDSNPETYLFRSPELTTLTYKPGTAPELMVPIYWSVRAKDSLGNWSPWSAPFTVTVVPPVPFAPVLNNPGSGLVTNNNTPELFWKPVAYAITYEIQIDTASSFPAPLVQEYVGIVSLSHGINSLPDGKYYWRVRARNLNNAIGSWSSSRDITIDTIKPIPPVLTKPLNGSYSIGTPTFNWLASATARYYQVQYDDVDDGTDTYDYLSPTNLTSLTHKPTTTPSLMTSTYWYVRSQDPAGNWSDWSAPFTITVVPPVPLAPVVSTPVSGLLTNNPKPTLAWNSVAYANTYEIQIDTASSFPAPLVQEYVGITSLSHVIDSLPDGKYYWRVRARNVDNAAGSWSSDRNFTIDTIKPTPPVLTKPINGSYSIGTPTFNWLASANARYYQLQYDDVDDGTTTYDYLSPSNITDLTHKITVTPSLMSSTYWYVRAQDPAGNWSDWSAPYIITIIPPLPVAPALTAPVSGLLTNNPQPNLAWNSVAYGATYEIQIDENFRFPAPLVQEYVGITSLSHVINSLPDGKYYWRVRARNVDNSAGSWSSDRNFFIDTTAPTAPVLSQPAHNAAGIRTTPTFTWSASSTANTYQFQYNSKTDFADPVTYTSGILTTLKHKPGLNMKVGTWYWRVRARDSAGNWGSWSAYRALQILPPL